MWKMLWRPFSLKPYGNHLLDGVVANWLLFVRLNIVSIALCDAVAWAYWARITASGAAGLATAVAAGVIVFVLVASVDASFVMHDTTAHTRPRVVAGRSAIARAFHWLRHHVRRTHFAVVVRIVLVAISFTVTAPFLAQFFFSRDIAAAIQRANEKSQAAKRDEIIADYDRQLSATRVKLAERARDLEAEVSGTGRSGRYGDGPTAAAIRRDVATYEADIKKLDAAKAHELELYAKASPELLAQRYGVDLEREGPDTRARVLADMEKSSAFRAMRNNIKWFLAFMFLALLTLKAFQPESVKNYYSADLQAAYARYLRGVFNEQLHVGEQSDHDGGMEPVHFVRWYNGHQRDIEEQQALTKRVSVARVRAEAQNQGFDSLAKSLSSDLTRMHEDLQAATERKDDLEKELAEAKSRLGTLHEKIGSSERELREFHYDNNPGDDVSLRDGDFLIKRKQIFERQLASNRAASIETASRIQKLTAELEDNARYRVHISEAIEDCGRQARDLATLINTARRRNMEEIASAG
jgi:hypothetical protein